MEISIKVERSIDKRLELWRTYFEGQDGIIRNLLVTEYMPLANKIAAFYYKKRIGGNADYCDYQNSAVIGLIQAIEGYQFNYGAKFETYASLRIKGNILNSVKFFSEKNTYLAHNNKRKNELNDCVGELVDSNPERGLFESIVDATLELTYSELLEKTYQYDNEPEKNTCFNDAYQQCEIEDVKRDLHDIVSLLPDAQQAIIRYYYFYELSFTQISELIGVTKGRVSQLHKDAMSTIRVKYNKMNNLNQSG